MIINLFLALYNVSFVQTKIIDKLLNYQYHNYYLPETSEIFLGVQTYLVDNKGFIVFIDPVSDLEDKIGQHLTGHMPKVNS